MLGVEHRSSPSFALASLFPRKGLLLKVGLGRVMRLRRTSPGPGYNLSRQRTAGWHLEHYLMDKPRENDRWRLRARAKIISHFMHPKGIWFAAHPEFRPSLSYPQLQNPRNSSLFLWFCSLGSNKDDLNPCA